MSTVDNRIVSLEFQNRDFEQGAAQSMSTLDRLKEKLSFTESRKGLDELSKTASNVNFSGMSNGLDDVHVKFSALDVISMTVLTNITNKAMDAAESIFKMFAIRPVTDGLHEYETQLGAIQTILANTQDKGSTIDDVNKALAELNDYADMTIYNFTQMTKNIGAFTAAGVGLEDSTEAIRGIANLAAACGASAEQANSAMYQLSHSLAAGKMSLREWRILTTNSMGGKLFQDALVRTARHLGTGVDAAIERWGSFQESLTRGKWATTEVLKETLKQISGAYTEAELIEQGYTKEQAEDITRLAKTATDAATKVKTWTQLMRTLSERAGTGWTQTWQIIFGDFYQAREFFSYLSDTIGGIIDKYNDARNLLLGKMLNPLEVLNTKLADSGVNLKAFQDTAVKIGAERGFFQEQKEGYDGICNSLDEVNKKYESFANTMDQHWLSSDVILETLYRMTGQTTELGEAAGKAAISSEDLLKVAQEVIAGKWGRGSSPGKKRFDDLTAAGYDFATVQNKVNELMGVSKRRTEEASVAASELTTTVKMTEDEIQGAGELAAYWSGEGAEELEELGQLLVMTFGRDYLVGSIKNIIGTVIDFGKAIGNAWRQVFPPLNYFKAYDFLGRMFEFTKGLRLLDENGEALDGRYQRIVDTFKAVFNILKLVGTVMYTVATAPMKIFLKILSLLSFDITYVTSAIANMVNWVFDMVEYFGIVDGVVGIVSSAIHGIAMAIQFVLDKGKELYDSDFVQGLKSQIADKLIGLFVLISDAIARLLVKMAEFKSKIADRAKEIFAIVKQNASKILGVFGPLGQKIIGQVKNVWGILKEFIRNVVDLFKTAKSPKEFFTGLLDLFKGLGGKLKTVIDVIKGLFSSFIESLSPVTEAIERKFGKVSTFLSKSAGVVKKIAGLIASLVATIVSNIGAAAAIIGIYGLIQLVMGIIKVFEGFTVPILKLKNAFSNLQGAISAYKRSMNASTILMLSAAVAAIAISLALLAYTAEHCKDGVQTAAWLFAEIIAGLILLMWALNFFSKGSANAGEAVKKANLAATLTMLAISVLAIAVAIKILSGMSIGELAKGIVAVAIALGVLIGGIWLLSKIDKQVTVAATSILAVAIGLLILSFAIQRLSRINFKQIGDCIPGILALCALIYTISKMNAVSGKEAAGIGLEFAALGIALLTIIAAITILSKMSLKTLLTGGYKVALIGLLMVAFMRLTNDVGNANAHKSALMVISIAVAIGMIAMAMMLLSFIKDDGLKKAVNALAAIGIIVGGLMEVSKGMGDTGFKSILGIAIAISVLALIAAGLSMIPLPQLIKGVGALGAIMLTLGVTMKLIGNVKIDFKSLMSMMLVIALLASIVVLLGLMPMEGALEKTAALSLLLIALAVATKILSNTKVDATGAIASAILLIGILAVIVVALEFIMRMPHPALILPIAIGLSILLIAIAGAMTILSLMSKVGGSITGALPAIISLVVIAGVIYGLAKLPNPEVVRPIAESLCMLLLSLSAAMLVMTIIGTMAAAVSAAVPAILVMAVIFGAIIALLAKFGKSEGMKAALETMEDIAETIGRVIGKLIGGIGEGITDSLKQMGADLDQFSQFFQHFSDNIASFDNTKLDTVKRVAEAIGVLAGLGIKSWLTNVSKLGTIVDAVRQPIKDFLDMVSSIGDDFDPARVDSIVGIVRSIAEMSESIPAVDGIKQWALGKKDLSSFTESLPGIAENMGKLIENLRESKITDADVGNAERLIQALGKFSTAANEVPPSNGLWQQIFGGKQLADFATDIYLAISPVQLVCELLRQHPILDSDSANIATMISVIGTFSDVANKVSGEGGVLSKIFSDKASLSNLGQAMYDFAVKFRDFLREIHGLDFSKCDEFSSAIAGISGTLSVMQNVDTGKISNFADAVNYLATADFGGMIMHASEAASGTADAGMKIVTNFIAGINSQANEVSGALIKLVTDATSRLKYLYSEFTTRGSEFAYYLGTGFRDSSKSISSAFVAGVLLASPAIKKQKADFVTSGFHLGQGLIEGIKSQYKAVYNAAYELGRKAVQGEKDGQHSNSPSKDTFLAGQWLDEGLILGMEDKSTAVYNAARQLGENASGKITAAAGALQFAIGAEDYTPTVAPIMDLGSVYSGRQRLNSLGLYSGRLVSDLGITIDNQKAEIKDLAENARTIVDLMKNGKTITIDGKTVIGYVDRALGAY